MEFFLLQKLRYLFLFLFLPLSALAQSDTAHLKHIVGSAVIVEANSPAEMLYPSLSTVTSKSSDELIRISGSPLLPTALSVLHPSLNVRNYGTQSGIALASFRGLAPEFTTLYRNGIRMTNEQNRLADLSLYGLRSADKVELLAGSNAQALAGDVGGAAIQIVSNSVTDENSFGIGTDLLTYDDAKTIGEKEVFASAKGRITDQFGLKASGSYRNALGDYPFYEDISGTIVHRENNDSYLTLFDLEPYYLFNENLRLESFFTFTQSERGVPGAVTTAATGASALDARQFDKRIVAAAIVKHSVNEMLSYSGSVSYQHQYETYDDTTSAPKDIHDKYTNDITSISLRAQYLPLTKLNFGFALEGTRHSLESNENEWPGGNPILRNTISGFALASYVPLQGLKLSLSARIDHVSDENTTQFLPAITAEYTLPDITIGGSFGRFYHPPTLNELYWKEGGNPDLEHEDGSNTDLWVKYSHKTDNISFSAKVNGFFNSVHNQIVWLVRSDGIFSPKNILDAETKGVDMTADAAFALSPSLLLTGGIQAQMLSSKNLSQGDINEGNDLPYAPGLRLLVTGGAQLENAGTATLVFHYQGKRYANLANTGSLTAVSTLDLQYQSPAITFLGESLPLRLTLGVTNITNIQYEEIPNYPLPGRTISFGIHFDLYTNTNKQ